MAKLLNSTSLLTLACALISAPALAFDVPPDSGPQAVNGTVTGTITSAGTLDGGSKDAIEWKGNAVGAITITNAGKVTSTKRGFDTSGAVVGNLTIDNSGLWTTTDDGIRVDAMLASGDRVEIYNTGTIESTGGGRGIQLKAVTQGFTYIWNKQGGIIRSTQDDAIRPGQGGRVINQGQIIGGVNAVADSKADGIDFDGPDQANPDGYGGTVDNYGTITGARHGITAGWYINATNYADGVITGKNGSGIGSDGHGTIWNYGTITGTIDDVSQNGDGDGVDIDYSAYVVNYGTIQGLGAKGQKDGQDNKAEGIAMGGGTVSNASETSKIYGKDNGILVDDGNDGAAYYASTITNYGTITGERGYGIKLVGDYNDVIYNYGSIVGGNGVAVDMGAGDDTFVYGGGSVTGVVKGGAGNDQFALAGTGSFNLGLLGAGKTYQEFENLYIAAGSTWTLTGTTDFAGPTLVSYGTMILDGGSLAKSVVTLEGSIYGGTQGFLAGTGTIGGLVAGPGGTVSPGTAPGTVGTLTVQGDVSFADKSVYQVTATAGGASDKIVASGATTIDAGASVAVEPTAGSYTWGTRYTILSSSGGVSGGFGSATSDYLFLTPTLSYDATNVFLTLNRNDVSFASYATTPNQFSVANAVERGGMSDSSGLYDAIVMGTTTDELRVALTQLSGDIYATLPGLMFSQSTLVNDTLLSRVRQAQAGIGGSPLAFGGPATMSYGPVTKAPGPFKAPVAPLQAAPVYTTWAQGYGQWLDVESDGNASAARSTVGGVLVGADASISNYTFGFAAGYASANATAFSASAETETFNIAAYAGAAFDALKLRAGATFAWSSTDTERTIALVGERAKASFDGTQGSLFAEAGYTVTAGIASFEPFAAIGWTAIDLNGFTEGWAPLSGLNSTGSSFDTLYSTLGLRAGVNFALDNNVVLRPHGSVGWRHAFGDVTPTAALAFNATGSAFSVSGLPIAEDSLVLDGGIDILVGRGLSVGVAYEGSFANEASYNAAKATATLRF